MEQYDFEFSVIENQSVKVQLSEDDVYYKITKYDCDCNTSLGKEKIYNLDFDNNMKSRNECDLDDPFICRLRQEFNEKHEYYKVDIKRWENFIKDIFKTNEVKRLGILIHFYHESCEEADFKIKDFKSIKVNQVNPELLLKLEEDILYTFLK